MREKKKNVLPYEVIQINSSLRLKQLDLGDAEYLFSIVDANRKYLSKWLPWVDDTKSVKNSREFISNMIEKRIAGSEYGYGIFVDDILVGHISLMHLSDGNEPEIGYWVSSNASERGIATKAAEAITAFGFNTIKLAKIFIKVDPDNLPSNRVAEKLGYKIIRIENDIRINNPANIWLKTNEGR